MEIEHNRQWVWFWAYSYKAFILLSIMYFLTGSENLNAQTVYKNIGSQLVEAELQFVKSASEKGIGPAFLYNLDPEGMVINGVVIINGIRLYKQVVADTTDLLTWHPQYARINGIGNFGFTAGPYLYYARRGGAAVASGFYFSIWQKDSLGVFKIKFDGGVSDSNVTPKLMTMVAHKLTGVHVYDGRSDTTDSIEVISATLENVLPMENLYLYRKYLAKRCLVLRPDEGMFNGRRDYLKRKTGKERSLISVKKGSGYAIGREMYYSFGNLARSEEQLAGGIFTGFYVRVWERQKKGWVIVADVQQYGS